MQLYSKCRAEFLVTSDLGLDANLREAVKITPVKLGTLSQPLLAYPSPFIRYEKNYNFYCFILCFWVIWVYDLHGWEANENGQSTSHPVGTMFHVWLDIFLTASQREFYDHKLLKKKKGQDGAIYLMIPLKYSELLSFLESADYWHNFNANTP